MGKRSKLDKQRDVFIGSGDFDSSMNYVLNKLLNDYSTIKWLKSATHKEFESFICDLGVESHLSDKVLNMSPRIFTKCKVMDVNHCVCMECWPVPASQKKVGSRARFLYRMADAFRGGCRHFLVHRDTWQYTLMKKWKWSRVENQTTDRDLQLLCSPLLRLPNEVMDLVFSFRPAHPAFYKDSRRKDIINFSSVCMHVRNTYRDYILFGEVPVPTVDNYIPVAIPGQIVTKFDGIFTNAMHGRNGLCIAEWFYDNFNNATWVGVTFIDATHNFKRIVFSNKRTMQIIIQNGFRSVTWGKTDFEVGRASYDREFGCGWRGRAAFIYDNGHWWRREPYYGMCEFGDMSLKHIVEVEGDVELNKKRSILYCKVSRQMKFMNGQDSFMTNNCNTHYDKRCVRPDLSFYLSEVPYLTHKNYESILKEYESIAISNYIDYRCQPHDRRDGLKINWVGSEGEVLGMLSDREHMDLVDSPYPIATYRGTKRSVISHCEDFSGFDTTMNHAAWGAVARALAIATIPIPMYDSDSDSDF